MGVGGKEGLPPPGSGRSTTLVVGTFGNDGNEVDAFQLNAVDAG
jgi:hypothetical protein